ncbi:acyl carrier protein [Granulicella mallensis]|uniref:Acyl carrier protein n=1 Tax=Granulicella mallensis TaxID=940614 RepID=A0A7W7ZUK3_9BACT|nr:acyl carrier protein [Granulicella mallensis]MBB5066013.1 acyl carrier protein [Granulicella mallensis]
MAQDEQRIRLTPKEWLLFVIGSGIALAAFRADDAVVVAVMLTVSAAAFVLLCVLHAGSRFWRTIGALVLVGILAIVGWRDLREKPQSIALAPNPGDTQSSNITIAPNPSVKLSGTSTPSPSKPGTAPKRVATTQDEITQLLVEQLQIDAAKIKPDSDLVLDLGASPLDKTEIIMQIEEAYGLQIPSSDKQALKSVGDLVNYIDKHRRHSTTSARPR